MSTFISFQPKMKLQTVFCMRRRPSGQHHMGLESSILSLVCSQYSRNILQTCSADVVDALHTKSGTNQFAVGRSTINALFEAQLPIDVHNRYLFLMYDTKIKLRERVSYANAIESKANPRKTNKKQYPQLLATPHTFSMYIRRNQDVSFLICTETDKSNRVVR